MSDTPAYRLTEPIPETDIGPLANYETESGMSAREMEAHTAEALRLLRRQTEAEDARAAIHATLALAWATRLGAAR